jgi:hypothetical protein
MHPTAELCRSQQAYHRERARTSLLENVRLVANKAAIAWGVEAEEAERRETRRVQTRLTADAIGSQKQTTEAGMPLYPSENPDLGRFR